VFLDERKSRCGGLGDQRELRSDLGMGRGKGGVEKGQRGHSATGIAFCGKDTRPAESWLPESKKTPEALRTRLKRIINHSSRICFTCSEKDRRHAARGNFCGA